MKQLQPPHDESQFLDPNEESLPNNKKTETKLSVKNQKCFQVKLLELSDCAELKQIKKIIEPDAKTTGGLPFIPSQLYINNCSWTWIFKTASTFKKKSSVYSFLHHNES